MDLPQSRSLRIVWDKILNLKVQWDAGGEAGEVEVEGKQPTPTSLSLQNDISSSRSALHHCHPLELAKV
jgi:hypothetical protein